MKIADLTTVIQLTEQLETVNRRIDVLADATQVDVKTSFAHPAAPREIIMNFVLGAATREIFMSALRLQRVDIEGRLGKLGVEL